MERDDGRLLREFALEQADLATAYLLRVALPGREPLIAGEQIARVRLHPNRPGLLFHGRVRESLTRSLFAFGMKLEHLPLTIVRGPRELDAQIKMAKAKRNLALADLQIAERGPTADLANCQGDACQSLERFETALAHYQRAKELADPASPELLEAYYGMLTSLGGIPPQLVAADASGPSQNRTAQISLCLEALEIFPLDAHLLCALGGFLQSVGQPQLAARSYEVAYRHGQTEPEIWHLRDIREVAVVGQSCLLQREGREDEALALLQEGWTAFPESLRIGRQIVELHVNAGRRDDALLAVSKLSPDLPGRENWRTAVQGAAGAVVGNWLAAKTLLETAYRNGCRERFCLRWLCVSLLATGHAATAEVVAKVWESLDGGHPELPAIRAAIVEKLAKDAVTPAEGILRLDPPEEAGAIIPPAKSRSEINI